MTELASMGGDTAADSQTTASGETRPPVPYALTDIPGPLSGEELRRLDAWWRAANYLSVGQIYLIDNPLLEEPLQADHVKPRLLGHFGTVPGLNLLYAQANRVIKARDLHAVRRRSQSRGPGPGSTPGPTHQRRAVAARLHHASDAPVDPGGALRWTAPARPTLN